MQHRIVIFIDQYLYSWLGLFYHDWAKAKAVWPNSPGELTSNKIDQTQVGMILDDMSNVGVF